MAFLELLPLVLLSILLISALGAFLCSRVLVGPVLEISRVSQRMARLDMTWDLSLIHIFPGAGPVPDAAAPGAYP